MTLCPISNPEIDPPAQIRAVIDELASLFVHAEVAGEATIELRSHVGSKFHRRVKTAASALGLDLGDATYDIVPLQPHT